MSALRFLKRNRSKRYKACSDVVEHRGFSAHSAACLCFAQRRRALHSLPGVLKTIHRVVFTLRAAPFESLSIKLRHNKTPADAGGFAVARLARFELTALCSGGTRSIQLS